MVTTLSSLVETIQTGAIPAWLRDYVVAHKDEIEKSLNKDGSYTFKSPTGEEIVIRTEKAAVAA
jgi:hypothetical protein